MVASPFDSLGVDIGFVQETECCQAIFAARKRHGYSILSTDALSSRCGGLALLFRVNGDKYIIEE